MEVELRAKIKDPKKIKLRLKKLGAKFIGKRKLKDYYFGEISLYKKLGHSFWLRVRIEGNRARLAYKGSTGKDGVYEEYEQEISDYEGIIRILTKSGFDNPITVEKIRTSYVLDDVNIEIDDFTKEGSFIEAEIISSKSHKKEKLYEIFKQLRIPKKDIFEKGLITLFLKKKKPSFAKWVKN